MPSQSHIPWGQPLSYHCLRLKDNTSRCFRPSTLQGVAELPQPCIILGPCALLILAPHPAWSSSKDPLIDTHTFTSGSESCLLKITCNTPGLYLWTELVSEMRTLLLIAHNQISNCPVFCLHDAFSSNIVEIWGKPRGHMSVLWPERRLNPTLRTQIPFICLPTESGTF